jgi:hypothetical protein
VRETGRTGKGVGGGLLGHLKNPSTVSS